MEEKVSFRGGAHIGKINASWPFASLSAGPDGLTLRVLFFGAYAFRPEEVVKVERYTILPIVGWGVRIHHLKADYPEKMIFWCLGSPDSVLRGIESAGFQPKSPPGIVPSLRTSPVRWVTIVLGIILWNALIGFDLWQTRRPGLGAFVALSLVFFGSTAVWWLLPVRWAVMKPGRSPQEIRHWLNLLTLVSGFMLAVFGLMFFTGDMKRA
jgi:hypothetical protein